MRKNQIGMEEIENKQLQRKTPYIDLEKDKKI